MHTQWHRSKAITRPGPSQPPIASSPKGNGKKSATQKIACILLCMFRLCTRWWKRERTLAVHVVENKQPATSAARAARQNRQEESEKAKIKVICKQWNTCNESYKISSRTNSMAAQSVQKKSWKQRAHTKKRIRNSANTMHFGD